MLLACRTFEPMTTRRDFLKTSAVASGLALSGGVPALARAAESALSPRVAPMRILVFGGTGYIGPHLVKALVARGHMVSIFSRGRHDGGDLPANIERLVGDRLINDTIPQGDLKALAGRRFDAVFDDPATDPRWVRQSATLLKDSGAYMFVSSTGVFYPYKTANATESAPTTPEAAAKPDATDRVDGSATYGYQKAQCEQIVMDVFRDRGFVVRPAYIVGPGDTSDRFTYWPQRLARGGETLAPGRPTDRIAIVDVRDLVDFMVKLVEEKRGGIYNVSGPREPMGFGDFLARAKAALKSDSTFVWAGDYDWLRQNRLGSAVPWIRLDGNNEYHTWINNAKAVGAGLKFRPLEESVRDVLAWWPERLKLLAAGQQPRFWTTPEREQQLLAAWKARG